MKHLSSGLAIASALFFLSACSGDDDGTTGMPDMGDMLTLPDMGDMGVTDDIPDMGPPPNCLEQGFGVACTAAMGCRIGSCQQELSFIALGGDNDPIDRPARRRQRGARRHALHPAACAPSTFSRRRPKRPTASRTAPTAATA